MKLYLEPLDFMSDVTKKVIANFNSMSNNEFMIKYSVSKLRYAKRVIKYGDPYVKAPLAKIGRFLNRTFKI